MITIKNKSSAMGSDTKYASRFKAICRNAGVKLTQQRLVILKEVFKRSDHPDAEMVFRAVRCKLPTVSLDTIYRTLWFLHDLGLVEALVVGMAVYALIPTTACTIILSAVTVGPFTILLTLDLTILPSPRPQLLLAALKKLRSSFAACARTVRKSEKNKTIKEGANE